MIPKLADISMFENVQVHANANMGFTADGQKPMTQMSVFNAVSQDTQQEINSVVRAFRDGVEQIRGKLHQERQQGGNAEHIDRVYVALEKAVSDAGRAAFHAGMEE